MGAVAFLLVWFVLLTLVVILDFCTGPIQRNQPEQ